VFSVHRFHPGKDRLGTSLENPILKNGGVRGKKKEYIVWKLRFNSCGGGVLGGGERKRSSGREIQIRTAL